MPDTYTNWILVGDELTNPEFIDLPAKSLNPEFPLSVWQCDPLVDFGNASCPLFPDWVRIEVHVVPQLPYIHVYPINTQPLGFTRNGLAILTPTACEETEELSGMWSVQLTHPLDPEGRYKFLQIGNILKVNGQLFTIKTTEERYENGTGYVDVYAEHIFYQWGDGWIYASPLEPVHIAEKRCNDAIGEIVRLTGQRTVPGGVVYPFSGSSNIVFDYMYIVDLEEGCTPIDLILGENGIIASQGGELSRDNFRFYIDERKRDARDNAFYIGIGRNLLGIKRTIDTSSMCTIFTLKEVETGNGVTVGWDTSRFDYSQYISHHVIRSQAVSYPAGSNRSIERIGVDAMKIFLQNGQPVICYEIDLFDTRQNEDIEIETEESFRCGDKGTLYDPRLGDPIEIEITQTRYDRITNRCIGIVVGNKQSLIYHPTSHALPDMQPEIEGGEVWVHDSTGRYIYDANGVKWIMNIGGD